MKAFLSVLSLILILTLVGCNERNNSKYFKPSVERNVKAQIAAENFGDSKTFERGEKITLKIYVGRIYEEDVDVELSVWEKYKFDSKKTADEKYEFLIEKGYDQEFITYHKEDPLATGFVVSKMAVQEISDYAEDKYKIKNYKQKLNEYVELSFELPIIQQYGQLEICLRDKNYNIDSNIINLYYISSDDSITLYYGLRTQK